MRQEQPRNSQLKEYTVWPAVHTYYSSVMVNGHTILLYHLFFPIMTGIPR